MSITRPTTRSKSTSTSTSAPNSIPIPKPSTSPNTLTQIHIYTQCPHTSPPANRPLNVQPILDPGAATSTIAGRCAECDQAFRRNAESAILTEYLEKIKAVERQYGVFDEGFLDRQVAELYRERDKEIERVWAGYSKRWGPGCVGRMENGRMRLAWERPEKPEAIEKDE